MERRGPSVGWQCDSKPLGVRLTTREVPLICEQVALGEGAEVDAEADVIDAVLGGAVDGAPAKMAASPRLAGSGW